MFFKRSRMIKLPEEVQGYIRFKCLNYHRLPKGERQQIYNLCSEVGKENSEALFEVLVNKQRTIDGIALRYFTYKEILYKLRKNFYEEYAKRYM